jgi:hypothetical protein
VLFVVAFLSARARADEFAASAVRPGYEKGDHLFMWEGRRALEAKGAFFGATYAADLFAAPQLEDRFVAGGLLVLAIDLELDKIVGEGFGALHVTGLGIHGGGPSIELMDLHETSGNTALPDVRLFEAWLEQPLGPFTVRGGLLSADQEFVLADHSETLMSATFGITSQFSRDALGPVYPRATPGASGHLDLDSLSVHAAIYDGTLVDNGALTEVHGIPTALGPDYLLLGELVAFGVVKLGAWRHSRHGNTLYAVGDAQLERHLGAFARVGYSPDGPVGTYIDAGIRIGPGPLRPDDFISLGVAFGTRDSGAETLLETTYEAQVGWLTLQPVVQAVMMPERTVGIVATRVTVVL